MTARPGHMTLAALVAGALVLIGCGGSRSGHPGSAPSASWPTSGGRGLDQRSSFDPRSKPLSCLRRAGLPARPEGVDRIVIGAAPSDPFVTFARTLDGAELSAVAGEAEDAEQIGRALLFVGHAPDRQLQAIERCVRG